MNNKNSILGTVKDYIGLTQDVAAFDNTLINLINAEFSTLNHEGVGPKDGYFISSIGNEWTEFTNDIVQIGLLKQLVPIKVKLSFDPPQNSTVMQAFERQVSELEWRLFNLNGGY